MQDIDLAQLVKTIGSEMRAVGATHCRLECENTKIELSLASDPASTSQAPPDEPEDYSEEKPLPRPGECMACQKRPIGGSSLCKAKKVCQSCLHKGLSGSSIHTM